MVSISTASQNAAADAVAALANGGTLEIRTGAPPGPNASDSGTLLVAIPLAATAYGNASGGTAALAGTPRTAEAAAGGTAAHFRVKGSGGDTVLTGTVGTSGEDLNLDNTSITEGQTVNITALPISMPASA